MPVVDADRLKEQSRRFVDGFTPGQKAMTILGVVAVVFAGMTFMRWASKPDMAPLYTGLSSQDAGAVTAALDAQHVSYKITSGGGTILVPRQDVDKTRVDLSAKNLPSEGADASGAVLHAPATDTQLGSNSQLAQAQAYDAVLEKRIEDMVGQTLGPGHAAVTVAATLDNSKSTQVSTKYSEVYPGKTVPITENNTDVKVGQGAGTGTNGQPGVSGAVTAPTTPTTMYQKTTTEQGNAVNSTTTKSDIPPGTVKRLSVSVLLDSAVVSAADVAKIWQPSILAASGIDPKRDGTDALRVTTVAFDKTAQKADQGQLATETTSNRLFDLIKQFLTLLMISVVLFFAWRAIKRAENNRVPLRVPIDLLEPEVPATSALEPALAAARVGSAPVRASLDRAESSLEGEITDLIERQPDEVAQTLRSWLADRRT